MLKIVEQNPFRILGVFANARPAEIVANCDDMEAYLSISQTMTFDLDFNNILTAVNRTTQTVQEAKQQINLPKEKLKYALFWFFRDSSSEHAMNHLKNGDFDSANSVFEIEDSFSTRINQSVVSLMQNNISTAIAHVTEMIHDDDNRIAFVNAICGNTFSINESDMAHLYIDALLEEIPASTLMESFQENGVSKEDNIYLKEKAVDEPTSRINTEISNAKSVARNDADANYRVGKALIKNTKKDLAEVKKLLGRFDMKYQMLADDLANTILQCGINYYNKADEDEEEDEKIEKALTLLNHALAVAIGKLTKDRCMENIEILEKKKAELPPKEARYYDKKIKRALAIYSTEPDKISYAIRLIKKVIPYLMSIREVLGGNNKYYLRISTIIANASLHNIIEEFNSVINDGTRFQLLRDYEGTMRTIRNVFDQAWQAILYLANLDMEPEFKKNRYDPNRSALKEQVKQVINIYQTVSLDLRGEKEIFEDCRTISDLNNYISTFPGGKYESQAKDKIEKMEYDACQTTQDCQNFKEKYPQTRYDINAKWEECYFKQCTSISQYEEYLRNYPKGKYVSQAKAKIDKLFYDSCRSVSDYKAYLSKFPHGKYYSYAKLIVDDEEMWIRCTASDSKEMYKEYLAKFPNGRHKKEASKKVKSCYIATMCYGDYDHPQVMVLRDFRDTVLLQHSWGQSFVRFYYRHSPNWVEHLKDKYLINKIIRKALDNFIILYKYVKK